ncbi:MAG: hypothetical protein Q9186_000364 [Xanthomendoza sp. 1 TL-2023]
MVKVYVSRLTQCLLLLAIVLVDVQAQAIVGNLRDDPSSSLPGPSTCPFTGVNHITQTLPQQCLAVTWAGKGGGQMVAGDGAQAVSDPPGAASSRIIDTPAASGTHHDSLPPRTSEHLHQQPSQMPTPTTSATASGDIATLPKQQTSEDAPDGEGESPLDNANFLSFEEWKKRNLAKAGQSPDNLGGARSGAAEPRRRPGGINNALDSLGEDTEIEIDFAGFVNPQVPAPGLSEAEQRVSNGKGGGSVENEDKISGPRLTGAHPKSKDAGVTCKERSNYASFDCAATMLKTNPESKSATSVLVENKDSYMLNECSAKNKFFIVELCNDILVDTVVLANFEFFSSIFRTFRVSVSDRYPVKLDKWRELATFEARNSRGIQAFLVKEPQIWARYLRIEFLTHYGNEYYCPVSLLRVHGTTMMEEFNHELKNARGDDDLEGEAEDEEVPQESRSAPDVVTAEVLEPETRLPSHEPVSTVNPAADNPATPVSVHGNKDIHGHRTYDRKLVSSMNNASPFNNSPLGQLGAVVVSAGSQEEVCGQREAPAAEPRAPPPFPMTSAMSNARSSISSVIASDENATTPVLTQFTPAQASTATAAVSSVSVSVSVSVSKTSNVTQSKGDNSTIKPSTVPNLALQSSSRAYTSTQPSAPNPTTQESFFKSVHKRLQLLESNSTLSLQYIEEQSRILRDAFAKVEKRQLAKTTTFLETLNTTVLNEVREFRTQYDQIWQSTVLELSSQRQQSQLEIAALSSRLTLLADELLFQKRIAILQFLLILLCFGLALFSRGSAAAAGVTYLEHVVNKSSINLSRYASGLESPPGSPPSTRPTSRYGFFSRSRSCDHRRSPSEESMGVGGAERDGMKSPSIEFEPATPTSLRSEESGGGSPGLDGSPSGTRDHEGRNGLLRPEERPESSSSSSGTMHSGEGDDGGS